MMNAKDLKRLVRAALKEDVGTGDVTSRALFPDNPRLTAVLYAKADGTLCGRDVFQAVFRTLSPSVSFRWSARDGDRVRNGDRVATISGPAQALLAGERTALNLIQHLSGVATLTARFVKQAAGGRALILDTRKTMPLLRPLEKYAVRTGGGTNHRSGLHDMALIKDNHIAGYRKIHGLKREEAIRETVQRAKRGAQKKYLVEIEVESLPEALAAYQAGADVIMFDNTTPDQVRAFVRSLRGRRKVIIEWSGGVALKEIRRLSRLPVDWISVGALTHSAPALDFSLKI